MSGHHDRFQKTIMMEEKTRYTDEELQEFKELILAKLEKAQREYDSLLA